jgi:hypothetical protein
MDRPSRGRKSLTTLRSGLLEGEKELATYIYYISRPPSHTPLTTVVAYNEGKRGWKWGRKVGSREGHHMRAVAMGAVN